MAKKLPVISHGPWSPSKAGLAGQCSLAFKFRYVDKIKVDQKGSAAKVGIAVHRAQELLLQGFSVTDSIDKGIEETEHELTETEKEDIRGFAQAILDFQKKLESFNSRYAIANTLIEEKWAVTQTFDPCDFFSDKGLIRGVVDLGLSLENGYVIIIDHKSGRLRSASYYGTQLDFYSIMALAHFPSAKGVQCALNYLAADKVVWNKPLSAKYIRTVLQPWLITYLEAKAKRVVTAIPTTGGHCNWCDYKHLCPAWGSNEKRSEPGRST